MAVGGLYDVFLEGTMANYSGIRRGPASADTSLVIGPWYHMPWMPAFGDVDFGPEAKNQVDMFQLAFFDQWLRDADPVNGPRVRVFVSGANRWQGFEDWPPASRPWKLHLRAHSRANSISGDGYLSEEAPASSEDPDSYSYDPAAPSLSRGGRSCCLDFVAPMGPMDQRPVESWNGVLVYSSEPLAKERLVAGTVIAHIFAATNQPDTDWVVKLCDVDDPGGPYSQAIRSGGFLFLAGQGPFRPDGSKVEGPFEDQARQTLDNLQAVAAAAGASLADAVRVGVYLRDMSNFAAMNRIYAEFFRDPMPARTTIQSDLPGFEIEVDAVLAMAG